MTTDKHWADEMHRFLDGEGPAPADEATRREGERYRELLAAYREDLEAPGPEVNRAVMAVVRDRGSARQRAFWRWFVRPREVRVSPLLAAAGLAVVIGLSAAVASLTTRDAGPGMTVAAARPGTVLVQFELQAPNAEQVALAGSFNGWSDSTLVARRDPATGLWTLTVPLPPGEHEYLFVVDGEQWMPDPRAHAQVDDGFGNVNSMIVVGPRGVVKS